MRAGELRHRITIEQDAGATRNSIGAVIPSWSTYATVWASKAHRDSREFFSAQKINAEITDLFTIRYSSTAAAITTKMRVSFGGKTYDILGADDPDGRRREILVLCKAVT